MPISPYTRERLAEAASASRTLTEALEHLGVDPKSGSRRYLHDRMRKLDVDISHFEQDGVKWTREGLAEAVAASTTMCDVLRRLVCGMPATWQGYPLPLEVDHIDGDWRNNLPENLRLLCPNCHSTTDSYRGRGKVRP
ncbi:HNH endonuclease [Streptomyces sp. NBC_00555]|uniref:HNH endonuclease signature motif containing protein n=1 Tax=Streptomyces sp. NBC_00555 TaxID=2903662 RepID=UPI002251EB3E|nr:HNH endonuclease signature motif containing protein [Streptomyces sp. NBC_00555]MCX5013731.1 HNH endonuclease [Streptomyces sp. NBC_00555]